MKCCHWYSRLMSGVMISFVLLCQDYSVTACHREFLKYYPSAFEQEWMDNIHEWQTDICTRIKTRRQMQMFNAWYNAADSVATENEVYGNKTAAPPASEAEMCAARHKLEQQNLDIFSKMEYRYSCPKSSNALHGLLFNETIEPLAGFLRDSTPVCFGKQKSMRNGRQVTLEDKNYIVFSDLKCTTQRLLQEHGRSRASSWRGEGGAAMVPVDGKPRNHSPRLLIIDLGATLYYWSLSGPSQSYLLQKYTRSGYTNLYRLLCYEANVYYNPKKIFWALPPAVIPHYQYFNVPITSEKGSKFNPLTMLKALAKPKDFVSLKLDVDNSDIEFSLIEQIIADPNVYGLIDEFFFEHHSNVKEFEWAWKEQVRGSMADGYKFFRKMRELGIRAHSWI